MAPSRCHLRRDRPAFLPPAFTMGCVDATSGTMGTVGSGRFSLSTYDPDPDPDPAGWMPASWSMPLLAATGALPHQDEGGHGRASILCTMTPP